MVSFGTNEENLFFVLGNLSRLNAGKSSLGGVSITSEKKETIDSPQLQGTF